MSVLGYHVVIKASDGRAIATTTEQRRLSARRVLEICAGIRLLVFQLADSHLHLALLESRRTAMRISRRIECALRWLLRLPVPFNRAHPEPIRSQSHLHNVFDYILRQQIRHNLDWDPYFEASSLSDLLGLRPLGAYTATHVREHLPRIDREYLLRHLGVSALEPVDGPLVLLREATLAAGAVVSKTRGLSTPLAAAMKAGIALCDTRLTGDELAEVFHVSRRTIQRYRAAQPDRQLVEAIGRQLHVRSQKPPRPGFDR